MHRRVHSDRFKAEAVERALAPGAVLSQIATDLDINSTMLRRWVKERAARAGSAVAVLSPTPVRRAPATDELEQLRKRVAALTDELAVVKAALRHYMRDEGDKHVHN